MTSQIREYQTNGGNVQQKCFTPSFISDYLDKSQLEEFLTNKSEDSIDDLTNKAAMSKLEIIEFPP